MAQNFVTVLEKRRYKVFVAGTRILLHSTYKGSKESIIWDMGAFSPGGYFS